MGLGQILVDFAGWTSCHGLPHAGAASNWKIRTFWLVISLASAAMFCWQFSLLYAKFTAYPVSIGTNLQFKELSFPAVTLCNLNPVKMTEVQYVKSLYTYPNLPSGSNQVGVGLIDSYLQSVIGGSTNNSAYFGFAGVNDTIALQSKAKEDLIFIAGTRVLDANSTMRFALNEFVTNCAFNSKACDKTKDFNPKSDPYFGQCYTFNLNSTYRTNRAGPTFGLRIMLTSEQAQYLPIIESAGARVAIHSQGQEPFVDAFGFNAATGFTTSFGIQYVYNQRLESPYGNCTKDKSGFRYNYGGVYTSEGCFRSCYQYQVESTCNCSDPRHPHSTGFAGGNCTLDNDCMKTFMNMSNGYNPILACTCPQPCTEPSYVVTVSNSLWPSKSFIPKDCQRNLTITNKWENISRCQEWHNNNTLLIEVYFQNMNAQQMTESPAYELVQLLSDLGGQLGLWLGLSVITLVEFISLLLLLCVFACTKCKKRNEPNYGGLMEKRVGQQPPPPYEGPTKPYENDAGNLPPPLVVVKAFKIGEFHLNL